MLGMSDSDSYSLVLPFDSDNPEFTRGFEIGRIYGQLDTRPPTLNGTIHATNAEMLIRVAEQAGYTYRGEPLGPDFLAVALERQP